MLTPFTRSANSNKVPSRNQKKGSDKMLKYQCLHFGPPKLQNNVDKTRETIVSFEHLPTSVTYPVSILLQYFDDSKDNIHCALYSAVGEKKGKSDVREIAKKNIYQKLKHHGKAQGNKNIEHRSYRQAIKATEI